MKHRPPMGGQLALNGAHKRSLAALLVTLTATWLLIDSALAQSDAELLPCGVPAARHLESGDTHRYLVTIPANETAVIDVSTVNGNLGLMRLIAQNTSGKYESCSGSITVHGDSSVTTLSVSDCYPNDDESGDYTVSNSIVSQSESQCGRRLSCGIVPGGIETAGAVVPYSFHADAGEQLNVLVTKFAETDRPARLRLYSPTGELVAGGEACSGSVRATDLPATGTYSVLVSTCATAEVGRFTMLREGTSCPQGPVITYFGVSSSDDLAQDPDTFDEVGRPVYSRLQGSGFSLVIEARPGVNGRQPGQLAFDYDANNPSLLPDLQILVSRPMGFGTPAVCDTATPQQAGIPSVLGFAFAESDEVSRAINDLGCRFNNGEGQPLGRTDRIDACTVKPVTRDFDFVDPSTTIQFCAAIARAWAFPPGDTIVKARIRDTRDVYSSEREIVIRAEGDSPFFLSDVTASELTSGAETVYFSAQDSAHGVELWKTDGTRDGTTLARDIIPGPSSSSPRNLVNVGDKTFFVADVSPSTAWVWAENGTPDSTPVSTQVQPPFALTPVDDLLFFFVDSASGGLELWRKNGQIANAEPVSELSSQPLSVDTTVASGGLFFFSLRHTVNTSTIIELWRSDGTTPGTRLVHRFSYAADADGRLAALTDVAGTPYFVAGDRRFGYGLWRSDGTSDGTEQLRSFSSLPSELTAVSDSLFFVATDDAHGTELWRSDGTQGSTQLVADINPGRASAAVHQLTEVNGRLFFAANDGTHGTELWTSSGTSERTSMVRDINLGAASSNPTGLAGINGALYLSADDGTHGSELWISDGTASGTVLALDIAPGNSSGNPDGFALRRETATAHGAIIFRALYGPAGAKLWQVPALDSIIAPFVCPGDCDGDDRVTVNELVTGVGNSLGTTTITCNAMDRNNDGHITVDELVRAVNSALRGCA